MKIQDEFATILNNSNQSLNENDQELLKEIKAYFEQKDLTWSIGVPHIKILCKLKILN